MGKKIYIISTITIFVLIVTIAIYNSMVSGNPNELEIFYPKEEIERIENSIIIEGLQKTNESSINGDKVDIQIGSIIYDNTFDDSFIDQDEEEKYNQKKQIKNDRNYRRVKKYKIDKGKDLIEQ